MVAPNITTYAGSKISTLTSAEKNGINGAVKIFTTDGYNFTYKNDKLDAAGLERTSKSMYLTLSGDIKAGDIEVWNLSTNNNSALSVNNADLKAVKAYAGKDGHIYLTAKNIKIDNSTIGNKTQTGDVIIDSDNTLNINNSKIYSNNNIDLSAKGDLKAYDSRITANNGSIKVTSSNMDLGFNSIDSSEIYVNAKSDISSANNKFDAKNNVTVAAGYALDTQNDKYEAGNNLQLTSNYELLSQNNKFKAKNDVNLNAKYSLDTQNDKFDASNNINLKSNYELSTSNNTYDANNNINISSNYQLSSYNNQYKAGNNINLNSRTITTTDDKFNAKNDVKVNAAYSLRQSNNQYKAKNHVEVKANNKIVYQQ